MARDLQRRTHAAEAGDVSQVLDPAAVAAALDAVRDAEGTAPIGEPELEVVSILAWFFWTRYLVRMAENVFEDLEVAGPLFLRLMPTRPDLVPEPLRTQLAAMVDVEANGTDGTYDGDPDELARHGIELAVRFRDGGDPADAEAGLRALRASISLTGPDDPALSQRQGVLGALLNERFEQLGRREDADEAVATLEHALATAGLDAAEGAWHLSNLGNAYRARFSRFGARADIEAAIRVARAAVVPGPPGEQRPAAFANLATALLARYAAGLGHAHDLDEAIDLTRTALAALEPTDPERRVQLTQLSTALQMRHRRAGTRSDLDEAVEALREAGRLTPTETRQFPVTATEVGNALSARFRLFGEPSDLSEALQWARAAVSAASPDDVFRPMYLSNAGNAHLLAFTSDGDPRDLDAAVSFTWAGVEATVVDDPDLGRRLSNLAAALGTRFDRLGDMQDADAAVAALTGALDRTDRDHRDRAVDLSNLSALQVARWRRSGDPTALTKAIAAAEAAVAAGSEPDPETAGHLQQLGTALADAYERSGDRDLAEAALAAFRRAATHPAGAPAVRMTAARDAAGLAARVGDVRSRAELGALAVELLPRRVWHGVDRTGRQRLLVECAGLGRDAAAAELATGSPGRSVELLEHGTGVLWGQLLDRRPDLSRLAETDRATAQRLDALRRLLDAPDLSGAILATPGGSPAGQTGVFVRQDVAGSAVDRRMALAREWDELVEKVRNSDGFEDFLRPPRLETLLPAAAKGPVVVVNVSRWRCDALIVRTEGVTACPLPELTLDDATQHASDYLSALHAVDIATAAYLEARDDARGGIEVARRTVKTAQELEAAVEHVNETLPRLQRWMWSAIAEPVLAALGLDRTPAGPTHTWPRLWWCPTGPLTVLPLHSAGFHDDPDHPDRRAVLDRVVSSYTPTLRALLEARARNREIGSTTEATMTGTGRDVRQDGRLLIVSLDHTPGQLPLDGTRERAALQAVPAGRRTELVGARATHAAVLAALPEHRWVHFSCHGDQDLRNPSHGGLLLHDDMLTIADVSAGQFHGDFAGLSACKSAVGGVELLDEAITLAAALHYTGYRHVVATLWSVEDDVSSTVFTGIYQRIVVDGRLQPDLAAVALHDVLRQLRATPGAGPRAWTPFTHTGP